MVEQELTCFEEQRECPSASHHQTNENDDQEWLPELAELDLGDVNTNTDDESGTAKQR
jgi:hypothetical protein